MEIWLYHINEPLDYKTSHRYSSVLDYRELIRVEKMSSQSSRDEFLCSRWLMKNVLVNYFNNIEPKNIHFKNDAVGKLILDNKQTNSVLDIDFSLSHCNGLIAFAIEQKQSTGIDIEKIGAIDAKFALRCFNKIESTQIMALLSPEREFLSCLLWTIKESFGKALGIGIFPVLRDPVFEIGKDKITFKKKNQLKESPDNWIFRSFVLDKKYIISVSTKNSRSKYDEISFIPLSSSCPQPTIQAITSPYSSTS